VECGGSSQQLWWGTAKMDNCPSENKNQVMGLLCALLVGAHRFESVTVHFFRVGHTHSLVDQRFGVLSSKLARARMLQTLEDPVGGRACASE
jgi:hypothetical protein